MRAILCSLPNHFPSAGPGYEITVNVTVQSYDQISVVWNIPASVRNQSLMHFDVTVESQSTPNPYFGTRHSYIGSAAINSVTFTGLGW